MTKKIQNSVLGTSGEYLVLSKLLLKGYVAGLAPDFTKDFDIVVVSTDGKHSAPPSYSAADATFSTHFSTFHK